MTRKPTENAENDDQSDHAPQRRATRRVLRIVTAIAVVAPPVALAGAFLAFLNDALYRDPKTNVPNDAQAVVALTGDDGRIKAALRLLAENAAPKMFVSGVDAAPDQNDLIRLFRRADAEKGEQLLKSRVEIGRRAVNTRQNAEEVAQWSEKQGIQSFILVTSDYHMPRSLLLMRRRMPEAEIHPYPAPRSWSEGRINPADVIAEFAKYVAALINADRLLDGAPPMIPSQ